MWRNPDSIYIDELVEFFRNDTAVYYVGRKVCANAELVCDGLSIDNGGNTPEDECSQIVDAACRAYEAVLGDGTTKCITFFHHANQLPSDPTYLAASPIERGEGWEDAGDDEVGERRWIERSELPEAAENLLAEADDAFDAAWHDAVVCVEAQHNQEADEWMQELIADGDIDGLRDALDNPVSCASDDVRANAQAIVDAAEEDE